MADSQESPKPQAAVDMAANPQDAPVETAKALGVKTDDAPTAPKTIAPNKATGSEVPPTPTKVNAGMNRLAERMMKLENGRPKPNPFPPCEPLNIPRRNRTSYANNSPFQLTAEDWPLPEPAVATDNIVSTDPNIPSIRVKNTDPEAGPSTNVPPAKTVNIQSPHHLQVVDTRTRPAPKTNDANNTAPVKEKKKTSAWDKLDRVLGLHRVRAFGDETGDGRLVANKSTYRTILLVGIALMVSFLASIIVVVTDGGRGGEPEMGAGWWAWMACSAVGFVGAIVMFVWAVQHKKKVLFHINIRAQVLRQLERADMEMNLVSGRPSNNEQQAQRARAAAEGSGAKCLKTGGVYKKGEWAEKK
ncbi:hypothetical protein GCG54_00015115 [Colletotrichum gloeosporioides]|uniref:Uncharacterized protein n=1 Tax=Colletotrichum gloeosporioides TaxID=474922 RepID=A0A8H4CDP5_COLGL|nr:uncharacterized protein GCG54_00015115 [Colletotrichum gloeosporioides]KAF3801893.1 hypothetical protein GCG54_00015115 [Colletotrichum gloeosporioides]